MGRPAPAECIGLPVSVEPAEPPDYSDFMQTVDEVPKTYEEAERLLVRWHAEGGPSDLRIFSFPDSAGEMVRLLEVSDDFLATGVIRPMTFGRSPEMPFRTSTALASPEEWALVQAGKVPLPPGWDLAAARQVWP